MFSLIKVFFSIRKQLHIKSVNCDMQGQVHNIRNIEYIIHNINIEFNLNAHGFKLFYSH